MIRATLKIILPMTILSVTIFSMAYFVAGKNSQHEDDKVIELAEKLWEQAIAAKGGREQLYTVKSLAVSYSFAANRYSSELYVFPDQAWTWIDLRPSKIGLNVEMVNFEKGVSYWIVEHLPDNTHKRDPSPEERAIFRTPQLIYLIETRWFRPELLSTDKGYLGFKRVDIVDIKVDQFRVGVFLDEKTHLPIRVGYYLKETGNEMFLWYGLSGYQKVAGVMMPTKVNYSGAGWTLTKLEINPQYDSSVFERPPSIAAGPEQWRAANPTSAPKVWRND